MSSKTIWTVYSGKGRNVGGIWGIVVTCNKLASFDVCVLLQQLVTLSQFSEMYQALIVSTAGKMLIRTRFVWLSRGLR